MYKICRTEKSLARQRELEEGFLCYLESTPYSDTDISKICRFLNIPRKTFYRYFDSKEGILHALIDHRLDDLDQSILQSETALSASLPQVSLAFFRFWKNERRFLDVLLQNQLLSVILTRACSQEYSDSRNPVYFSGTDHELNRYIHSYLMTGAMSLVFQWQKDGFRKSIEEMAGLLEYLQTTPLKSLLLFKD